MKRFFVLAAALLGMAVPAVMPGTVAAQQSIIQIDGSSTVFPITEAVAEEFQKAVRGATRVTVGISGTGGGFKKFCRGETDITNASRPIKKSEMDACKEKGIRYVELPVAFDALTIAVHPQNTWLKSITVAELKKMWEPGAQNTIMNWNQVNPSWPDAPLRLFGPGSDSGTFDYFTEAVVGKSKSSRGDFTASEDDNVLVKGVSRDKNALGYFGFAYYMENTKKLRAVPVVEKAGASPVSPSFETVKSGAYRPLSRPVFLYISAASLEKKEVRDFVEFYLKNAARLVKEVKFIPLPSQAYDGALENVQKKKYGTVFGGESEVGLSVEALLKKEASH